MTAARWRPGPCPPDIATRFRERYPGTPADVRIVLRALRGRPASHPLFAVERADGGPGRLLLKAPRLDGSNPAHPATEYGVLTEIGPALARENPAVRCPTVLGRYGDPPAILMEMLDRAVTLKALALGLAPRRSLSPGAATALAGDWLARFHRLTRLDMAAPVEFLRSWLAALDAKSAIERHAAPGTTAALAGQLDRLAQRFPGLRRPRCLVHGFFVAEHVLVQERTVWVIDLESCRSGFAFEDLASATVWPELLVPWRRGLARWRVGPGGMDAALHAGYAAIAGPLDAADLALVRVGRVLTVAKWLAEADFTDRGWREAIRRVAVWPLWCRRFRSLCRRELAILARD